MFYYLIKGSYKLNKKCLNKLAGVMIKKGNNQNDENNESNENKPTNERQILIKTAEKLVLNEMRIEKKASLLIGAKCKIALGEAHTAQMLIEKLSESYSDEGMKLGIELQNQEMKKGGDSFEKVRNQQRMMLQRLKVVNSKAAEQLAQQGNQMVVEVVVKELIEYQQKISDKLEEIEEIDIAAQRLKPHVDSWKDLIEECQNILNESENETEKRMKHELLQYCLLQFGCGSDAGYKAGPLIAFCLLLKETNQKNLVLQAAKAIRVAAKLGSQQAVEIAKAMANNKDIQKLLGEESFSVSGDDKKPRRRGMVKALASFV